MVGVVGDRSLKRFSTRPEYQQLLVDVLAREYPLDHEVIVYRAATLPIERPRIRRVPLRDVPATDISAEETVVLPPAAALKPDQAMRDRLLALEAAGGS